MSVNDAKKVAAIVRDAGGSIVGRTRLQKIAYLLTVAGLEGGLSFSYKHYGPYSEQLATATREADLLGFISEKEQRASWGGFYSTYSVSEAGAANASASARRELASLAANADAIELELAATAVFLAKEGFDNPWAETARRKPEKATGRIEASMALYGKLRGVKTPEPLPAIS